MRRLIIEEPYSEAAVWSQRLAVFALVLAGIGALLTRISAIEAPAGLTVFGASIIIACAALLLAGAGMVVIWRTGRKGIGKVVVAILLAVILLAYPSWLAAQAVRIPLMNDISTDVNDPPAYARDARLLALRNGRTPPDVTQAQALEQQRSFPDIQPIVIDVEAKEGFELVRDAVIALGWSILEQQDPVSKEEALTATKTPPQPAQPTRFIRRGNATIPVPPQRAVERKLEPRDGRIDAVARSPIMGFPDDIVIRIRALPDQTRIDIRSASRYGRHDFGVNAKRIRAFAAELQAQLDAE